MRQLTIAILIFFIILVPVHTGYSIAQSNRGSEYLLKSVFLERFCRFIEWPREAGIDQNDTFVIGVIGETSFNAILEKVYASQPIQNKRVEIRYYKTVSEIGGSQLLFIAKTDRGTLRRIIDRSMTLPLLTVSDTSGYASYGVHINMFVENEQIRFEINNQALKKSGFSVSSLLLNVAKIVETSGEEK